MPDAALRAKIGAREAVAQSRPKPDGRQLTNKEMNAFMGRGPYRNPYFNGLMPWQRAFRDVNLCNGNLFKSFTDFQIAPARGAGLALQRTYNSNEDREGPFGTGWTHAYDIRIEESPTAEVDEDGNEIVPRTDFFGGKHRYTRDADGLYTPPAYMFDELDSKYDEFLVNGPSEVLEDTQHGMDGTVKHFVSGGTDADNTPSRVRVCDYIEDRHGNRTELTYGLTITFADGRTEKKLTKVTDPSGRELNFTWSNLGTMVDPHYRITEVVGPTGTYRVTYDYNGDKNLSAVHLDPDGLNRTTSFGYTSYSGPNGMETGLLASITDPLGHVVSYEYSTEYIVYGTPYPNATGTVWVSKITEPAGIDATNSPRVNDWYIVSGASSPDMYGAVIWTMWGNSPLVINNLSAPFDPDKTLMFAMGTDAYGRKINFDSTSRHFGVFNLTTYDTSNNVTSQYQEHADALDSQSGHDNTIFPELDYNAAYSDDGRTLYDYGFSTLDEFTYGPHGNVLTESQEGTTGLIEHTYYDATKYFQKASTTDRLGRTTAFDYFDNHDAFVGNRGEVKWVRDARYSTTGKQFEYGYNQHGQKVWEKNLKDVVTTFSYGDTWGNLTSVVQDPDDMVTSHVGLKRTTTTLCDVYGRVLGSTDPNGQSRTFTHNTLGQPLTASLPTSVQGVAGEGVSYSYGANGRTETVTDGRGTTTFAYETGCDRIKNVTDPVTGTVAYRYKPTGERESMTFYYRQPSQNIGAQLSMLSKDDPNSLSRWLIGLIDDQGRIVQFSFFASGTMAAEAYNNVYTLNGTLQSCCLATRLQHTSANLGVHAPYSNGNLYRLRTTFYTPSGGHALLSQNIYTYNDSNLRTTNQIKDHLASVRTEQYGYDELNRLTSVNYGDGQTQGYTFDAMGNRLTKTDSVTNSESYTYNAANMLTWRTRPGVGNSQVFVNDENGNCTWHDADGLKWDSQNRLRQYWKEGPDTLTSYEYNADGLRRRKFVETPTQLGTTTEATNYILDGSNVIQESVVNKDELGSVTSTDLVTYLQGSSGPMYRRPSNAADVRWYVFDGLGSVVAEADVNGTVSATKKQDIYGLNRGTSGTPTSKHGFVGSLGHTSEEETGLIYMRARYYNPEIGRFASEDSAGDGTNWFVYCDNNPVNHVDADGRTISDEYINRIIVLTYLWLGTM